MTAGETGEVLGTPGDLRGPADVEAALRAWGYRVELTPWDVSDLPDRARELIQAMILLVPDGCAPLPDLVTTRLFVLAERSEGRESAMESTLAEELS